MNKKSKKFLYLMNVSWHWIKQRPHFLAIYLSNYHEIDIIYRFNFKELFKKNNGKNISKIFQIPFNRFKIIRKFNDLIYYLNFKIKYLDTDIVWVSSPLDFQVIKSIININSIVIYDCMDDFLEFDSLLLNYTKDLLEEYESQLCNRANYILVSSNYLGKVLVKRYNSISNKIHIVNNAIDKEFINTSELIMDLSNEKDNQINLMYVGTIAEWIDFDLILTSLNKYSNIVYTFVGPISTVVPKHDRLIYLGKKNHNQLKEIMIKSDALIMPFIINDLILSVNPVKLYEYISVGKPIITSYYNELDQFADFIYTYQNPNSFYKIIEDLIDNKLHIKSINERVSFLNNNTWDQRVKFILNIVDEDFTK